MGLHYGHADAVMRIVEQLRTGGPKTVFLILNSEAPERAVRFEFETEADLGEFICRAGAVGLRNGDDILHSHLKNVRQRALCAPRVSIQLAL